MGEGNGSTEWKIGLQYGIEFASNDMIASWNTYQKLYRGHDIYYVIVI